MFVDVYFFFLLATGTSENWGDISLLMQYMYIYIYILYLKESLITIVRLYSFQSGHVVPKKCFIVLSSTKF